MRNSEHNKQHNPSSEAITGCGSDAGCDSINLNITTTTGGAFPVFVDTQNSVENLKKIIAKKLKVAKERICLLHRERELQEGNLKDNGLVDGSKIILIPNVETGLLAQRPENTVMQALESLNDTQVNDFLSGKTPLNLSMRLGDHMMLIQLQLSTVSPSSSPHNRSKLRSRSGRTNTSSLYHNTSCIPLSNSNSENHESCTSTTNSVVSHQDTSSSSSSNLMQDGELNSFLNKHGFESIQNIVKKFSANSQQVSSAIENLKMTSSEMKPEIVKNCSNDKTIENNSSNMTTVFDQSPIKSLSNLVSNPIKSTSIDNIQMNRNVNYFDERNNASHIERVSMCSDPISAKLTSCLCKRLGGTSTSKECELSQCQSKNDTRPVDAPMTIMTETKYPENLFPTIYPNVAAPNSPSSSPHKFVGTNSSILHKTVNNPIIKHKHRHLSECNVLKKNLNTCDNKHAKDSLLLSTSLPPTNKGKIISENLHSSLSNCKCYSNNVTQDDQTTPKPTISATDARALAEASRNLTQTLRKLSKEVFTNKVDLSDQIPRKSNSGAVIESMKNHGKGIYSGTFSGTLNPALQDQYGRPKRDISTVIHILNDLLSATPQYNRDTRISFESSLSASERGFNKQLTKHISTPGQECKKCVSSSSSANRTCAYGKCNGHTSSLTSSTLKACESIITANKDSLLYIYPNDSALNNISEIKSSSRSSNFNLMSNEQGLICTCNNSSNGFGENDNNGDDSMNAVCSKCSFDLENSKTKCKLDQLKLVMQQRKQKREARKLKGTPYGARLLSTQHGCNSAATGGAVSTTLQSSGNNGSTATAAAAATATTNTITSIAPPSEVSPNHIVEEVDTAA